MSALDAHRGQAGSTATASKAPSTRNGPIGSSEPRGVRRAARRISHTMAATNHPRKVAVTRADQPNQPRASPSRPPSFTSFLNYRRVLVRGTQRSLLSVMSMSLLMLDFSGRVARPPCHRHLPYVAWQPPGYGVGQPSRRQPERSCRSVSDVAPRPPRVTANLIIGGTFITGFVIRDLTGPALAEQPW